MSDWDFPQIIELADGTKCVRLEDFKKRSTELKRERDAAREDLLTARRHCSLQNEVIESLRDQLCADKCRDKAAADGGWGNL